MFVPGVAVTFRDAAYAPNAIAMPPTMRTTPSICRRPSTRARPVFNFISAMSALNWPIRSMGRSIGPLVCSLVMLRSSLAQVCGRQFGFHRGGCPEVGDPAADHDPHPVCDAEHGARELLHDQNRHAL